MADQNSSALDFVVLRPELLDRWGAALSQFGLAAGKPLSPAHWRWRCAGNPAGSGATAFAVRNGRVVGLIGSTYVRTQRGAAPARAALISDLYIMPSERSWPCLAGLLRASAEQATGDGVEFAYGFFVGDAVQLNSALGARVLCRVPVWAGFLDVGAVLRGRGWPAPLHALGRVVNLPLCVRVPPAGQGGCVVCRSDGLADAELADLPAPLRAPGEVCAVRDLDYLRWRYARRPDYSYTVCTATGGDALLGLAVYRTSAARRTAYLTELLAPAGRLDVLQALLRYALQDMQAQEAGMVTASFPEGSDAARVLRQARFQRWATPLWDLSLGIVTDPGGPELEPSRWYFSLGDWLTH